LHRDIKPSNVLLAWSGRAMLLDFNLSATMDAKVESVAGTLAYMAPELVRSAAENGRGEARRFDPRVDVYSLGVVLYELLSGRLPMTPGGAERLPLDAYVEWLECKQDGAAALDKEGLGVDPRLVAIVMKCLEYEPARRYATAGEAAAELRVYLSGAARLSRFAKRNRRAIVLAALGLVGSGVSLGVYLGTRPTELEAAYRQGLAEYERGQFDEAVKSFTRCLELRAGWPQALFGRGQALRRLEKWEEARTDYRALEKTDPEWSLALSGYCSMQMKDDFAAWGAFMGAHRRGLRDVRFLMNYGRTLLRRQLIANAAEVYAEVVAIDPNYHVGRMNRAYANFILVINDRKKTISQETLNDARECCRLDSQSFESSMFAAIVFGEAAKKDAGCESEAMDYLTKAIDQGMPVEVAQSYPYERQLKRLLDRVDEGVIGGARHDSSYRPRFTPAHDPPNTADWDAFQSRYGKRSTLVAQRS